MRYLKYSIDNSAQGPQIRNSVSCEQQSDGLLPNPMNMSPRKNGLLPSPSGSLNLSSPLLLSHGCQLGMGPGPQSPHLPGISFPPSP